MVLLCGSFVCDENSNIRKIEIKEGRFFSSGKVVSGEMPGGIVSIGVVAF